MDSSSDRARGDGYVDELLAHEGYVRGLAARLARNSHEAEELVQDTWLSSLRRPPGPRGRLRSWIAGVMRHQLLYRRRQAGTRAYFEGARLGGEPSGALPALDEEVCRLLAEATLNLHEPYRTTLVLRFYEGLGVSDIARRLDVPVETVRTRVKRGLQRVREQVGERLVDGDQRASRGLLAWFARLRVAWSRGAGPRVALWGACAAALVVATGTLVLSADRARSPDAVQTDVARGTSVEAEPLLVSADAPPERAAAGTSAPARTALLRVERLENRAPLPGVAVEILAGGAPAGTTATGADGTARVTLPAAGTPQLRLAETATTASVTLAWGPHADARTIAVPARGLRGRVVDEASKPLAGARVHVVRGEEPYVFDRTPPAPMLALTTDSEGWFFAGEVPADAALLAWSDDGTLFGLAGRPDRGMDSALWPQELPCRAEDLLAGREVVVHAHPAVTLDLLVVDPAGGAVEGAEVTLKGEGYTYRRALTRADGTAAFALLESGRRLYVGVRAPGRAPCVDGPLVAGERPQVTLELTAAGALTGEVVDAHGDPVAGARVHREPVLPATPDRELLLELQRSAPAVTDAAGRFRFAEVGEDRARLTVLAGAGRPGAQVVVEPDDADLVVRLGSGFEGGVDVRGACVDAVDGRPLADCTLRVWRPRDRVFASRAFEVPIQADGSFAFSGRRPDWWLLGATAEGYAPEWQAFRLDAGASHLELALHPARDLPLRLLDERGAALSGARILLTDDDGQRAPFHLGRGVYGTTTTLDDAGRALLGQLPLRPVQVHVLLPYLDRPVSLDVGLAQRELDEVVLRVEGVRRVERVPVRVTPPAGAYRVRVLDEAGACVASWSSEPTPAHLLPQHFHRERAGTLSLPRVEQPTGVWWWASSAPGELTLPLPPGPCRFEVARGSGEPEVLEHEIARDAGLRETPLDLGGMR
ncbi:MAG: sigma-70 family RNA polymerase sigma factor [Planctomycetota bacterium]